SLKLKASEPSLRRAVVPISKPGRVFGNGNGGAALLEPAVEANGRRHVEPELVEEAFESVSPVMESVGPVMESVSPVMESVGSVMEQGGMAAAPAAEPEWVSQ